MKNDSAQSAKWPELILIVRHGQSAGNVARDYAEKNGLGAIEYTVRDMDVPLSPLGEKQAGALGKWFRNQPESLRPTRLFRLLTSVLGRRQTLSCGKSTGVMERLKSCPMNGSGSASSD